MDTFRHDVIVKTGVTCESYSEAMALCEEITDKVLAVRNFLAAQDPGGNDPLVRDFAFILAIMAGTKHAGDRF